MTNKNPLSAPEPWTLVAEGYVTDTQPLFRQYCEKALELSGFNGAGKVLDVACGPGTLSLLISNKADEIHSVDFSEGMLSCFNTQPQPKSGTYRRLRTHSFQLLRRLVQAV